MKLLMKSLYRQVSKFKLTTLTLMLLSLISIVLIYAEIDVLDKIIKSIANKQISTAYYLAIIYVVIISYQSIKKPLYDYLINKLLLSNTYFLNEVVIKLSKISVATFDVEENNRLIERVKAEPDKKYTSAFENMNMIITELLSILIVIIVARKIGLIFFISLITLVLLLIVFIYAIRKSNKLNYLSRSELTRKETYINGLFFEKDIALERKNYDYHSFLESKLYQETKTTNVKLKKNIFKVHLVSWIYDNCTNLFVVMTYFLLIMSLSRGEIEFSFFIAMIPAIKKISVFFVRIVNERIPSLLESIEYFSDEENFYKLENQLHEYDENKKIENIDSIKFNNVYFTYPSGERVIENLNLELHKDTSYALVGENGCGKSTLVKLLMGLYTPESGEILVNGISHDEYTFNDKMHLFGAVFQDYGKYELSVLENISMEENVFEKKQVENAVGFVGLTDIIASFDKGYNTILGKSLGEGIELSTGQWQKIAIARMINKKKQVMIFDEPTASLDPISESNLYTNYKNAISGKGISLFVTHRLGAAVMADTILVMDKGKIVEIGTHDELTDMGNSIYNKMYSKQRGLYI